MTAPPQPSDLPPAAPLPTQHVVPPADPPSDDVASAAPPLHTAEDEALPAEDLGAVESLAAVTLAPVARLQHAPWLLRSAMACQVTATVAVGSLAWWLGLADWGAFLAMGAASNVLVGNIMRWRLRWGWIRRGLLTAFSCGVTWVWILLLLDRAVAGTRQLVRDEAASPWFWLPASLLVASFVLLVLHFVIGTRRDQAWLRQQTPMAAT